MSAQVIPFPMHRVRRPTVVPKTQTRGRYYRTPQMREEFMRRYNIAAAKLQVQGGL